MDHLIRHKILQYVEQHHTVSVPMIAEICSITLPTARKYLKILHNEQLLDFQRGKVSRSLKLTSNLLGWHLENHKDNKQKIGTFAASLVQDGDTIFIGAGTTVTYMIEELITKKGLTIVTNSILIINKIIIYPHILLICTGGTWRTSTHSFDNRLMKEFQHFHPDKTFIGTMALDFHKGVTQLEITNDEFELFQKGKEQYILADSSKFNNSYSWTVLESKNIQSIITDTMSTTEILQWQKIGTKIFITP